MNDHFIVSDSLFDQSLSDHKILDDPDNLSDHKALIITLKTEFENHIPSTEGENVTTKLKWEKLNTTNLENYTTRLHNILDAVPMPTIHCQQNNEKVCRCRRSECAMALQKEYDFLIKSMKCADSVLPRHKPGLEKDWWTEGLSELRQRSLEIHALWVSQGKPRQGPIHSERLQVRASYKRAIRAAQRAPKQAAWDRLHSALAQKNTNEFWKVWRNTYNKNKNNCPSVVDGVSSKQGIANLFMNSFKQNSTPNNKDNVENLNKDFETKYKEYIENHRSDCDCKSNYMSLNEIIDALSLMKRGKSADEDSISFMHL